MISPPEAQNATNPYENAPAVEAAMQWALEDLLTNKKQPSQEDLAIIPQGEATNIIHDLSQALQEGGELELVKAFKALSKMHDWLKALRNKSIPSRSGAEGEKQEKPKRKFLYASEVQEEQITWISKNRIALGSFSLVVGDPGLGKSLVLTKLAAGITTGKGIPDSQQMEPGGVIIMAPEDSNSRTIVPRLKAAGADLTKVLLLSEITETDNDGKEYKRPISFPEDVGILEEAMIDAKAKLVIIDPVLAMISAKQDTHKDQQIRIALGRVISLAEQYEMAVMGVVHLNKNQGGNVLYRSGASIALIAMARTGLFLVPDPDDEDMCVLVNHKNNLSMKAASLRFSIHQTENEIGYIQWEGISSYSEQELLSQSTPTNNPKSQQEMDIMAILKNPKEEKHPAMTIAQIHPHTEQSIDALEKMLNRKVNQGILMRPARGLYTYVGNPLYTIDTAGEPF